MSHHSPTKNNIKKEITDNEVKSAISTILKWIGEDPNREGLKNTPKRVMESFKEYFSGYSEDPNQILQTTFTETSGYKDIIILKDIELHSHCEHHMAPIQGVVHIGYYPNTKIVGISKLARVVEIYAKRLQIQERLTSEIMNSIYCALQPKGVAVMIEASHGCINNRGIRHKYAKMKTYALIGCFRDNTEMSKEFFQLVT